MEQITLTLDATPENLKRLERIFSGTKEEQGEVATEMPEAAPGAPANTETSETKITKTELRALGLELTKSGKSVELKEALKEFGAAKLSSVKEEDYDALYERLEALR